MEQAFEKIKTTLATENPGGKISIQTILGEHECIMTWSLNKLCNFRCSYCWLSDEYLSNEHPDTGKYPPEHIAKCFNDTGKNWLIILSGGEPFLYPDFAGLAEALTENHHIVINTNLSTKNVFDFGGRIHPGKVILINASMHMGELLKRNEGLKKYIEKFLYLQERGFNIYLSYVAYPPFLARIESDIGFFKSVGIKKTSVKYFHGMYNAQPYPDSYTEEEKNMIRANALDPIETDDYQDAPFFYRKECAAGQKLFSMDMAGNLKRCSTLVKQYGNFFTGNYRFGNSPKPCPAKECLCPYEGFLLTGKEKGTRFSVLREVILEKYYLRKAAINK